MVRTQAIMGVPVPTNDVYNLMKKSIFITIGVLIIVLVVGIWAYLFTYGAPESSDEIFARFGAGRDVETTTLPENTSIDVSDTSVEGAPQALKQLTTRPVAGATFVGDSIHYVEQGTGHIYSVDLLSGSELLMSGTTLPGAREAFFSDDGLSVAITLEDAGVMKTLVGTLEEGGQFTGVSLPDNARNIAFSNATGTIQYTISDEVQTVGYSYNTQREVGTQVFAIPLRDIRVLWGNPTYVYTVPSATQTGYIYRIVKNNLLFVTEGAPGLSSFQTPSGLIVTRNSDTKGVYSSALTHDNKIQLQAMPLISEKCTSGETFLYCAVPRSKLSSQTFPDDWFMGTVSFGDILWSIDSEASNAEFLVDFTEESGREMDVSHIGADKMGNRVFLINKNDNTLWLFDTTVSNVSL
jgi:hypothetical protein